MQGYQVDGGGIGDAPPRPKKPLEPTSDGRRRALSFADPRTVKSRLAAPLRSANSIKHPGRGSGMKNSASDGVLAAAEGTYRPLDGTSAGGIGEAPHRATPHSRRKQSWGDQSHSRAHSASSSVSSAGIMRDISGRELQRRARPSTGATDTSASTEGHVRNLSSSTAATSEGGFPSPRKPSAHGGPVPQGLQRTTRLASGSRHRPSGVGEIEQAAHGGSFVASLGLAPIGTPAPARVAAPARLPPREHVQPGPWGILFDPTYRPAVQAPLVKPAAGRQKPTLHKDRFTLDAGATSRVLRASSSVPALRDGAGTAPPRRGTTAAKVEDAIAFQPKGGVFGTFARPRPSFERVQVAVDPDASPTPRKRPFPSLEEPPDDQETLHVRGASDAERPAGWKASRPWSAERVMAEILDSQAEREQWRCDGMRGQISRDARRRASSMRERQRQTSLTAPQPVPGRPRASRRRTSDSAAQRGLEPTTPRASKLRKRRHSAAGVGATPRTSEDTVVGALARKSSQASRRAREGLRPLTPTFLAPRKVPPLPAGEGAGDAVPLSFDALFPVSLRRRPSLSAKEATSPSTRTARPSLPTDGDVYVLTLGASGPKGQASATTRSSRRRSRSLPDLRKEANSSAPGAKLLGPLPENAPPSLAPDAAGPWRSAVVSDLEKSLVALPPSEHHKLRREAALPPMPASPTLLNRSSMSPRRSSFGFSVPTGPSGDPTGLRPAPRKSQSALSATLRASDSSRTPPGSAATTPGLSGSVSPPPLVTTFQPADAGPMDSPTLGRGRRASYFAALAKTPTAALATADPLPSNAAETESDQARVSTGGVEASPSHSGGSSDSTVDLDQPLSPETLFYSPPVTRPANSVLDLRRPPSTGDRSWATPGVAATATDSSSVLTSRPPFRREPSRNELVDEILNGYLASPGAFGTPLSAIALASATSLHAESFFTAESRGGPATGSRKGSTRYSVASTDREDLETAASHMPPDPRPTSRAGDLVDAYELNRPPNAPIRPPLLRLPRTGVPDNHVAASRPSEQHPVSPALLSPDEGPDIRLSASSSGSSGGLLSPNSGASRPRSEPVSIHSFGSAQSLTHEIRQFPAPPNTPLELLDGVSSST